MKFKSEQIAIPLNNPMINDKLNRKVTIENITNLLINVSSPIVLSINAPWGTGKTTFVKMLNITLQSKDARSIYFNAWESDFTNEPLVAFLSEMNSEFEKIIGENKKSKESWEKAKKIAVNLSQNSLPIIIKGATAGLVDLGSVVDELRKKTIDDVTYDIIESYSRTKKDIQIFKENILKILENNKQAEKIFIFVDELDRCRPTYAIELLERIKHLLDIKGLVFILSMDKEQLSHSVKSLYGSGFEAKGYLRRFIDIEYKLKIPTIDEFIDFQFEQYEWDDFFKNRSKYNEFKSDKVDLSNLIKYLAVRLKLSLREIEQVFAKVNLVILSTNEQTFLYPPLFIFLLLTKEYNPDIYYEYASEFSTPNSMINYLYELIPTNDRLQSDECILIEAFLLAAKKGVNIAIEEDKILHHEANQSSNSATQEEREYSQRLLEIVKHPVGFRNRINLKSIINRIEMLENFNFNQSQS